jgi:hypothetical protein
VELPHGPRWPKGPVSLTERAIIKRSGNGIARRGGERVGLWEGTEEESQRGG